MIRAFKTGGSQEGASTKDWGPAVWKEPGLRLMSRDGFIIGGHPVSDRQNGVARMGMSILPLPGKGRRPPPHQLPGPAQQLREWSRAGCLCPPQTPHTLTLSGSKLEAGSQCAARPWRQGKQTALTLCVTWACAPTPPPHTWVEAVLGGIPLKKIFPGPALALGGPGHHDDCQKWCFYF